MAGLITQRENETAYPFGTLYEYENGLRILHKKPKEANKTTLRHFYLGGKHDQKFGGQAHFVEYLPFVSGVLDKLADASNANTSPIRVQYYFDINHDEYKNTKEISDLMKIDQNVKARIGEINNAFFNEISRSQWSEDFTENDFENEKKVIDNEFLRRYDNDKGQTVTRCLYNNFISGIDYLQGCGNYQTLKDCTLQDVVDFRNSHYTLENYYFVIETPLEYDKLEQFLVNSLSEKVKSNPNGYIYYTKDLENVIDFERYNIANENSGNRGVDVYLLLNLDIRNQEEDFKKSLVALFLLKSLQNGFYFDEHNELRKERGLIYTNDKIYLGIDDLNLFLDSTQTVNKENLAKYLISRANTLSRAFSSEFTLERYFDIKSKVYFNKPSIKSFIENKCKDNDDAVLNYQDFSNKKINECQKFFENLFLDEEKSDEEKYLEIQALLREVEEKLTFNISLLGDGIELKDLPSFDYLRDVIKGKNVDYQDYPKNMAEDIHSFSKVAYMGRYTQKALVVAEEKQEKTQIKEEEREQ